MDRPATSKLTALINYSPKNPLGGVWLHIATDEAVVLHRDPLSTPDSIAPFISAGRAGYMATRAFRNDVLTIVAYLLLVFLVFKLFAYFGSPLTPPAESPAVSSENLERM